MILLVFDSRSALRSLSCVLAAPEADALLPLEKALREGDRADDVIERLLKHLPRLVRRSYMSQDGSPTGKELTELRLRRIEECLSRILPSFIADAGPMDLQLIRRAACPLGCLIVCGGRAGGRQLSSDEEEFVLAMLNATPQAEAQRDARVMEQVGAAFAVLPDEAGAFERKALALAKTLTGASCGATYVRSQSEPHTLHLGEAACDLGATSKVVVASDPTSELHLVLDLQRSIQVDATDQEFFIIPPNSYLARRNVLLTPIPWVTPGSQGPAAGLIGLLRSDGRAFSAYDVALVRNIALRLAMERASQLASRLGHATATLRKFRTVKGQETPDQLALTAPLPTDLRGAVLRVDPTLDELQTGTGSQSVSLRFLLPSPSGPMPFGMVLQRAAGRDVVGQRLLQRIHQPPDGGVNWSVVRTGESIIRRDVTEGSYTKARPGTRSELCVPVRVEGRMIGTLNLESVNPDNYGRLAPLVESFAGAIGRTVADAGLEHTRQIVEAAIAMQDHWHAARKPVVHAVGELRDIADHQPVGELSSAIGFRIRDLIPQLQTSAHELTLVLLSRLRDDTEMPVDQNEDYTLGSAIDKAAGLANILTLGQEHISADIRGIRLQVKVYGRTVRTLKELFQNLVDYREATALPASPLSAHVEEFDGRPHIAIWLNNAFGRMIGRVEDLYRFPVEGADRSRGQRLGAYLAGLLARGSGGSLAGCVETGGDAAVLRSVLVIPVHGAE